MMAVVDAIILFLLIKLQSIFNMFEKYKDLLIKFNIGVFPMYIKYKIKYPLESHNMLSAACIH